MEGKQWNIEHKIIPSKLFHCYICHKDVPDYTNLEIIKERNLFNSYYLSKHLGRRSVDNKYFHKYIEDEPLKPETKYLDQITGKSFLWTVCDCERVAHPDCFLQSIDIFYNNKCSECGEIYKLGYKVREKPKPIVDYIRDILRLVFAFGFFILFLILLTRNKTNMEYLNTNKKFIIIMKLFAFLCLYLFITIIFRFIAFLFNDKINKKISIYLLPYAFKYDSNFGIEKYDLIEDFNAGMHHIGNYFTNRTDLNSKLSKENTKINPKNKSLQCPYYDEIIIFLKRFEFLHQEQKEKILQKHFLFRYDISYIEIVKRFISYLMSKYNFSLTDLISMKIDREFYFNSIIKRNTLLKEKIEEFKQPFKKSRFGTNALLTYTNTSTTLSLRKSNEPKYKSEENNMFNLPSPSPNKRLLNPRVNDNILKGSKNLTKTKFLIPDKDKNNRRDSIQLSQFDESPKSQVKFQGQLNYLQPNPLLNLSDHKSNGANNNSMNKDDLTTSFVFHNNLFSNFNLSPYKNKDEGNE